MAGHSHWAQIKHKKNIIDKKRGMLFSKIAKMIEVAAKSDPNPDKNPQLRVAVERAKQANMPSEKIEYIIKKAQGLTQEKSNLEEILIEGLGPEGVGILIEAITDNKNRTIAEIRNILNSYEGRPGQPGSVSWNFQKKGVIEIDKKLSEDVILSLIDKGAEDIKENKQKTVVLTDPKNINPILEDLKKYNIKNIKTSIEYFPKTLINVSCKAKEKIKNLYKKLNENEDVKNVYLNINLN